MEAIIFAAIIVALLGAIVGLISSEWPENSERSYSEFQSGGHH